MFCSIRNLSFLRCIELLIIGAIVIISEASISKIVEYPADVDTSGKYSRGSLSLEKYPWILTGTYNNINIIENFEISEINKSLEKLIN